MTAIGEFMTEDHDRIDVLLDASRDGGDRALDAFAAALSRHIVWEEESLFPALTAKAGAEAVPAADTMRLQHEDFRARIEEIRRAGDPALRRRLHETLAEALSEHNYAEEAYIYPWIDSSLDPAESARLRATLAAAPGGGRTS